MSILVTGGAGYIGSHTAKALARAGNDFVVLDDLSTGRPEAVRWSPLVVGSLEQQQLLRTTLRQFNISAVIHFAASVDAGESTIDPAKYYRNNVVNTLNLLDAMHECGVGQLVFSSSCAVYGEVEAVPVQEDHPQRPISPYGASKLMVEHMLRDFGDAYGLRWVALRYFNAAGADPEGELGSHLDHESGLIPRSVAAALGEQSEVEIFGTDYPTPDGTGIRDYVHVSDLAEAHVAALAYLAGGGISAALNLGTGRGFSVREVVRAVEKVSGRSVRVREVDRRRGDAPAVVADASRALKLLDWQPQHSEMEQIVRTAWNWQCGRARRARA
jgi:UDP-arabinose 4-epimerase